MDSPESQTKAVGRVGLIACGRAGCFSVDVDQSLSGPDKWYVQIDGPSFWLYFQVDDPQAIADLLAFIEQGSIAAGAGPAAKRIGGELTIGHFGPLPVSFIWDEETVPRIAILIDAGECTSRMTLWGDDLRDLTSALRQVRDELRSEGFLTEDA